MQQLNPPARLNNDHAASYIGVAPQTLRLWRSTKRVQIPYLKLGTRCVRYEVKDLDAYLAAQRVEPTVAK